MDKMFMSVDLNFMLMWRWADLVWLMLAEWIKSEPTVCPSLVVHCSSLSQKIL